MHFKNFKIIFSFALFVSVCVYLLICLLFHRKASSSTSVNSVLSDLEFLPDELIERRFIRPAIYLAASIFKFCSTLNERSVSYLSSNIPYSR